MIISHRCQFVVFSDPFNSCQWLNQALAPWADQPVSSVPRPTRLTPFFQGMSPAEAERAFAKAGLDFSSYTRMAVVQNPFRRMAELYDRISLYDPIWRLKTHLGRDVPDFSRWLTTTQPSDDRLVAHFMPRWRRFGAQTTQNWAAGRIDAFIRAEFATTDLRAVFGRLGVAPLMIFSEKQKVHRFAEMLRYDHRTTALIHDRYAADLRLYNSVATELDIAA